MTPVDGQEDLFDIGPQSALDAPVRAFRTVLLLARRLQAEMDRLLRPSGLSTQQAAVVTAVIALGSPSLVETATALGTSRQNVAQIVDALVRKGLLTSEPDPRDRRRLILRATEENTTFWARRDSADYAAVASWFAVLDPAELESFCGLADRILSRLSEPKTAAAAPERSQR